LLSSALLKLRWVAPAHPVMVHHMTGYPAVKAGLPVMYLL
jgi:hypothetical protein